MQAAQKPWNACVRRLTSQESPWLLFERSPGDVMAHRSQTKQMGVSSKMNVCCPALGHAIAFSCIHWVTDFLDDDSAIVSVHGFKNHPSFSSFHNAKWAHVTFRLSVSSSFPEGEQSMRRAKSLLA